MEGNFFVRQREPATLAECMTLVRKAREAYDKKTKGWVKPSMAMIDKRDLDGSRKFLENVVRTWKATV